MPGKKSAKAAPKKGAAKVDEEPKEEKKVEEPKKEEEKKEEEKKEPEAKAAGGKKKAAASTKKAAAAKKGAAKVDEEPKEEEKKEEPKKEEEKKEEEKKEPEAKAAGGKKKAAASTKKVAAEKRPSEEEDSEQASKKAKVDEPKENAFTKSTGTTDFSVPSHPSTHLKIISWNVASFKSVMEKGFEKYLENENPDIICIQETKRNPNSPVGDVCKAYPHKYWYDGDKPGYAGTATFSKIPALSVKYGIGIPKHDKEGRVITTEFEKFYLVNTYIPNSGSKLERLDERTKSWDPDFLAYLKDLDKVKPVIWTGDLNVAHQEIDLKNPTSNKNRTPGFCDAERANFTKVLESGFVDTYRKQHPTATGEAYSFWSYKNNARANNSGWRLDYWVVSERFYPNCDTTFVRQHVTGSDHCPIGVLVKKS